MRAGFPDDEELQDLYFEMRILHKEFRRRMEKCSMSRGRSLSARSLVLDGEIAIDDLVEPSRD